MKISDVKVGEEYGALDSPTRGSGMQTPRPVKVLEIVMREEKKYSQYSSGYTVINKKWIKVQALGDRMRSSWHDHGVDKIAQGETITIEPRKLVGLWSEMKGEILAKIEAAKIREELYQTVVARVEALGFARVDFYYLDGFRSRLEFRDPEIIERVLGMLEQAAMAAGTL